MTQHYTIAADGSTVDVWDHTGTKIAGNRTVDGTGVPDTIGGTFPDEVREALAEEAVTAAGSGNTQYAITIIADLTSNNVSEGSP